MTVIVRICKTLTKIYTSNNSRLDSGVTHMLKYYTIMKMINYGYMHQIDESQKYTVNQKKSIEHYSIYMKFKTATTK